MSTGQDLAADLDRASAEFTDYARGLSPEQWRTRAVNSPDIVQGEDENRPVGVIVHHVADWLPRTLAMVEVRVHTGDAPRTNPDELNRINAEHAAAHPDPDQAETLALLAERTKVTAAAIAALTDEELARGPEGGFDAESLIRRVMIGHFGWHLGSIKATFASQ